MIARPPAHRARWRRAALAMLLCAGLLLAVLQPVSHEQLLGWGESMAGHPWSPPALVAVQVLLFALGMPGTVMLWVIAPFFSLPAASALLLAGSVAGAAVAYLVATVLGAPVTAGGPRQRIFLILARRGDFLTQCALRVMPGFPHSAINFAGGLLRLPPGPFLAAAALGMAVKWPVYVYAVQGLLATADGQPIPDARALLPLLVLAGFLVAGGWLRRRLRARLNERDNA